MNVYSTSKNVSSQIGNIKEAGIKNIMALRGDIPADRINDDRSLWAYNYAIELIREIKEIDNDFVSVQLAILRFILKASTENQTLNF